jgi:hypothetical protein
MIKANYTEVFATPAGQSVLADLERIVQMTRIDSDNPNANSAIYKCAQLNLLQRIYNQIEAGK